MTSTSSRTSATAASSAAIATASSATAVAAGTTAGPTSTMATPEAGGGGGRKVGMGHFNFVGNRHGELVCDFLRDGGVSDDLSNIVWRKIYSDPGGWQYNYRRGRGADLRGRPRYHGGYNRRSRFHDFFGGRGRYSDGRGSWHGHHGQGFRRSFDDDWSGDHSGEDFGHHNWRRYDHLRSGDFYGRPRHISGYTDWYTNDDFYSSTRVYTQGSRSTLYIRDFRPADFGRYRCYATRRGSFPYREETVYMDVDFRPRQRFV
ncbi:uncharacterized protein LOC119089707 [Pollicipes pollicipes]|uniref:uncharacterized protein LOC119089707 n=1 Tax=Pollicipes pollicipes TaxID=41117 RepID=UPI0018858953|nr:uncharacterized protein LOC119089707 [Pollicipes pollicipes]